MKAGRRSWSFQCQVAWRAVAEMASRGVRDCESSERVRVTLPGCERVRQSNADENDDEIRIPIAVGKRRSAVRARRPRSRHRR